MTAEEIHTRVNEIFRDVLDNGAIVLRRETTADDVAEWDSLEHMSIIVAIEREFGIRFALTELKLLKNVGELFDLIAAKTA